VERGEKNKEEGTKEEQAKKEEKRKEKKAEGTKGRMNQNIKRKVTYKARKKRHVNKVPRKQ
jgi:hypothetical protein